MNRFLAYLFTFVIFVVVFLLVMEGGLRLMGKSPQPTINAFHPRLGWVKKAGSEAHRRTSEFDVTYRINSQGLREDEGLSMEKPAGVTRILFLGDSFTLGYTVDRNDLFVDLLEKLLVDEGRKIEVINAGTEGYSSDQELLWLREEGLKYSPDIVVMDFYQNDVFWNSQDHYMRFPKPLFPADGAAEKPILSELTDPGEQGWFAKSTAVGKLLFGASGETVPTFQTSKGRVLPKEWGVLLREEPPFIEKAWEHTAAVLRGFKATCEAHQIKPLLALIPAKAQIYAEFKKEQEAQLGLPDEAWNPNMPFDRIEKLCRAEGLDLDYVDPRPLFDSEAEKGARLYYTEDRHFSPEGNRVFAKALYYHLIANHYLDKINGLSQDFAALAPADGTATAKGAAGLPTWLYVVLGLWVVLGLLYAANYRDENGFLGFLKVGALIWVVVGLIGLLNWLAKVMPGQSGRTVLGVVVLGVVVFLLWKLRKRAGIIVELYMAFTNRGHWYMMPLLAVMLAIGSLLIVAASSPFVAPFIYTLF